MCNRVSVEKASLFHLFMLHSGITPLSGTVTSVNIQTGALCGHTNPLIHTFTQNFLQTSWKDIWTECGTHTQKAGMHIYTHMQLQNNVFCLWQQRVTLYNNTLVWGERGSWLNEVSGNERWPVSLAHKKGQSGAARTGQSPLCHTFALWLWDVIWTFKECQFKPRQTI